MAGNFVFLVHGMGTHAKGWSKDWKERIEENAKLFAPYSDGGRALSEDVEFVELEYDSVFEKDYRQRWKTLAGALADSALPAAFKPALSEIAQVDDAKIPEFAWTHLLDPLLWFGLRQAREAVIAKVAAQLSAEMVRAQAAEADVHILAHSLGTSVIHDTLLCLAADEPEAFDPKRNGVRWDSLVTIANVSRFLGAEWSSSDELAVEDFKPHSSRVRPGDLVEDFVNVRHRCDPFTFPRTYKPDWKAPPFWVEEPDRFDEILHVHDLETQFDHPKVARRCLRLFTGRPMLGAKADEMAAAWQRYEHRYGKSGTFEFSGLAQLLAPDAERKLGLGEVARYLTAYAKEALS